tara:strand:- start:10823 stop:11842 length:1020 start_codon:yes stop_codon:yes gene_type:complete
MGLQSGLAMNITPPNTQTQGTEADKILSRIAPSEYRRSIDMNTGFTKSYFAKSLNNVDKLFSVEGNNLVLNKSSISGEYTGKPFPTIKEAWDDYSIASKRANVVPNHQEFSSTYENSKAIYDNMLLNKMAQIQSLGFTPDDINEALSDDQNYSLGKYISSQVREKPEFASYTPAGIATTQGGMMNKIMENIPWGVAAGFGATKIPFLGKKFLKANPGAKNLFGGVGKSPLSNAKKLVKWGYRTSVGKSGAAIIGSGGPKKTSGAMNRFLRGVNKIAGPKVARKVALKLATLPIKGAIPFLGWAWIAKDIYDLTSIIGSEGASQIKSLWEGEMKNQTMTL